MQSFQVRIHPQAEELAAPFTLDAPSLPLALIVADINTGAGIAEIWQEERRLARIRKRRAPCQTFWEVG